MSPLTALTHEQKRKFKEEGYIVIHNLIGGEDLIELDKMTDLLFNGELHPETSYHGQLPEEFYTFWEPGKKDQKDIPRKYRIRLMAWMFFHHPYFRDIACHPAIHSVVSQLLNSAVKFFSDSIFMKPPKHGIAAALHQDTSFWPKLEPRALNFWMAVDRATIENGCLHLIPGTQKVDRPHKKDPVQGNILPDDLVDIRQQIPIELEPGSAIFFDSGLAHRSYPNHSEYSRRAYAAVYVSENVQHIEPWRIITLGSQSNLSYEFEPIQPSVEKFKM